MFSLRKELSELQSKINDIAGENVNPNSPKQLSTLLFEKLSLNSEFRYYKLNFYNNENKIFLYVDNYKQKCIVDCLILA